MESRQEEEEQKILTGGCYDDLNDLISSIYENQNNLNSDNMKTKRAFKVLREQLNCLFDILILRFPEAPDYLQQKDYGGIEDLKDDLSVAMDALDFKDLGTPKFTRNKKTMDSLIILAMELISWQTSLPGDDGHKSSRLNNLGGGGKVISVDRNDDTGASSGSRNGISIDDTSSSISREVDASSVSNGSDSSNDIISSYVDAPMFLSNDPVIYQDTEELQQQLPIITIVRGDITMQGLEAVVNAANSHLEYGSGVAGAVSKAGGLPLRKATEEWISNHKSSSEYPVKEGLVAVTGAGDIKGAKIVIHAVGPRGDDRDRESKLRSAIKRSLEEAENNSVKSIAIPALSCGVFGYPTNEAARVLCESAVRHVTEKGTLSNLEEIRFVLLDFDQKKEDEIVSSFEHALAIAKSHLMNFPEPEPNPEPQPNPDSYPFKAAGVLLVKGQGGVLRVLLGLERRPGEGLVLNLPGGKRDRGENPLENAAREFWEETGEILKLKEVQAKLNEALSIYISGGKYYLYVLHCPEGWKDIDMRYERLRYRNHSAEMENLRWYRWESLLNSLTSSSPALNIRQGRLCYPFTLSKFIVEKVMAQENIDKINDFCSTSVEDALTAIERELKDRSYEKTNKDSENDWKLRLKAPKIDMIKSPVSSLKKDSVEYKEIIKKLPSNHHALVYNIRKVDVRNRIAAFKAAEHRFGNNIIKRIDCTIHGTPEVWRATDIAHKGFDLNIQLHGRALGNGVYSSTDVSIPFGYVRGAGSLILMKGLLTAADNNSDPIFVFRTKDQVLPQHLVDFAADNSDFSKQEEELKKRQEEEFKKRKTEMEKMKKQESEYEKKSEERRIKSAAAYKMKLEKLQKQLQDADDENADMKQRLGRLYYLERSQYYCKPRTAIYCQKWDLVDAIMSNDVIVLSGGTGSGKSTQTPQYALDEVMTPDDKRRVAVLEPRRFNAESLCTRVSMERGQDVGMEVGFSLGQGDIIVTEGATRIEFMTHGLFINRAMVAESLIKHYGVVILDEAHERSTDVDLCLALLKKALELSKNSNMPSFKVIIASATVSDENLHKFRKYLAPEGSSLKSNIFKVEGTAFPVMITYRPEAEPDWNNTGALEQVQALASYSLEVAIQLISDKESDGNILVFMPGEGPIKTAINSLRNWDRFVKSDAFSTSVSAVGEAEHFKFNMRVDGKHKPLNVGVFPFHSKIRDTTRQHILYPDSYGYDRIIIFSTNAAETGLTLKNIRYVIDTGLERRVTWNRSINAQEMRSVKVTQSSMKQRAGRAGRERSGVCVRLYSEESITEPEHTPKITDGSVLKTVLAMYNRISQGGDHLELLTEIPPESKKNAEAMLKEFGALEDGTGDESLVISEVGKKLISLGLPLRLGKFVMESFKCGCLAAAVDITAMANENNIDSVLPNKKNKDKDDKSIFSMWSFFDVKATEYLKYIDPDGDFFSFLKLYRAYVGHKDKLQFCKDCNLDHNLFESAVRARDYINRKCISSFKLDQDAMDKDELRDDETKLKSAIRQAICSAFFDQLVVSQTPGQPEGQYVRLFRSPGEAEIYQKAAADLARSGGLIKQRDVANINHLTVTSNDSTDASDGTANDANDESVGTKDSLMSLSSRSSLWTTASDDPNKSLAIFNTMMLTDSSRGGIISHITYVTQEDVERGARNWVTTSFSRTVKELIKVTEHFDISDDLRNALKAFNGNMMKKHITKYFNVRGKIVDEGEHKNKLEITAPRSWIERFKDGNDAHSNQVTLSELEEMVKQRKNSQQKVTIIVPKKYKEQMKSFKNDIKKSLIVNDLNNMLRNAGQFDESRQSIPIVSNDLKVDLGSRDDDSKVELTIDTAVVQFKSLLYGSLHSRVANYLMEDFSLSLDESVGGGGGSSNGGVQGGDNASLKILSINQPPSLQVNTAFAHLRRRPNYDENRHKRDSAMLCIAHHLLYACKLKIYGGFVRDLVIRNETANDIDCGYEPSKTNVGTILKYFQSKSVMGLTCVDRPNPKGMAHALNFSYTANGHQHFNFDVDLTDLDTWRRQKSRPGVDCDVGNLMLSAGVGNFVLQLKVNNSKLVSMSKSIEHCKNKQFVFYYDKATDEGRRRLQKYQGKNWQEITNAPYDKHWWTLDS